MRLTCPNCGAQYEVPDEVIPETGRDVQCSNCGDTWFQNHPSQQSSDEADTPDTRHPGWDSPDEDADADDFAPEEDVPEEDVPEPSADEASAPEEEPAPEPDMPDEPDGAEDTGEVAEAVADDPADEDTPEEEAPDETEPEIPARRGLDPSIADVLREEAAREEEARAAESGGLETQPDLGLDGQSDDDDQRSQEARSRMARMRGLPEDSVADADDPEPHPGLISRRNLLPDIDEINSSLDSESVRAEADHGGDTVAGAAAGQGGFGKGFRRAVLLVLILVILYLLAPMISENIPALAGVLKPYVDTVNAGRIWLNDMVGSGPVSQ